MQQLSVHIHVCDLFESEYLASKICSIKAIKFESIFCILYLASFPGSVGRAWEWYLYECENQFPKFRTNSVAPRAVKLNSHAHSPAYHILAAVF